MYKILIIDDSALMRRVMSDIIEKDNRFEVSDVAIDGVEGLDMLIKHNGQYDIVLLDINMPRMNGLDVLERIKKYRLKCKVIVVSTLVKDGAKETILALENGALDFVLKPTRGNARNGQLFEEKLLQAIRLASGLEGQLGDHVERKPIEKVIHSTGTKTSSGMEKGSKVVALACSTGGPKSLKEVIPHLPKDLDAPILLVQHMPAGFTKSMADRLNELSEIAVEEAKDGELIEKGHVYIAPGGKHLKVQKTADGHRVLLGDEPPRDGLKPCANLMYDSLIESDYQQIIGVVLTGMGSDGTNGITNLSKEKEVYVISQDAKTSIVYGMPRAITNAGLADEVLPLDEIASAIIKKVGVLNHGC